MSKEKTEWAILKLLADAWASAGAPGIIDNKDLIAVLGIAAGEATAALQRLFEHGAIDRDDLGYASYLTPEGYELAQTGDPGLPIVDQIRKIRIK